MRNYHDMGGEPAGPIDREEHPLAYWEKRVEALISVLASKGGSAARVATATAAEPNVKG